MIATPHTVSLADNVPGSKLTAVRPAVAAAVVFRKWRREFLAIGGEFVLRFDTMGRLLVLNQVCSAGECDGFSPERRRRSQARSWCSPSTTRHDLARLLL